MVDFQFFEGSSVEEFGKVKFVLLEHEHENLWMPSSNLISNTDRNLINSEHYFHMPYTLT